MCTRGAADERSHGLSCRPAGSGRSGSCGPDVRGRKRGIPLTLKRGAGANAHGSRAEPGRGSRRGPLSALRPWSCQAERLRFRRRCRAPSRFRRLSRISPRRPPGRTPDPTPGSSRQALPPLDPALDGEAEDRINLHAKAEALRERKNGPREAGSCVESLATSASGRRSRSS